MANRSTARGRIAAALLTAAAAAALAGCGKSPAKGLTPGDASPAVLSTGPGVRVAWVVREEDLLACRNSAKVLRAVQARFGTRVDLAVVVVGRSEGLAEGFLLSERLHAVRVEVNGRTYRAQFGGTSLPSLLVLERGRVRAAWRGTPGDEAAARTLAREMADVLGAIARAEGEHHSPREEGQ